jgi:hypothetical protein
MARRRSKKNPLDSFYPQHRELIAEAMDEGIIVKLDPLEYPIFMLPGAFARNPEEKKMKGSAAFDPKLFAKQNKLAIPPKKAQLRKELKKTVTNMILTVALLKEDGATVGAQSIAMMPSKKSASHAYAKMEKAFNAESAKLQTLDQKDALLMKYYAKLVQELAPLIPEAGKKYKKHKAYFDALARTKPSSIKGGKKPAKKKAKAKPKKKSPTKTKTVSSITYKRQKMKNGRWAYYKVSKAGKKTRISKDAYDNRPKGKKTSGSKARRTTVVKRRMSNGKWAYYSKSSTGKLRRISKDRFQWQRRK